MKPITFPEARTIMGADQPEYLPLPCHRGEDGQVISLWQLGWRERVKIFFTGKLWLRQLTFNQPLQPQRPDVDRPFVD